jgi:hypothetical protein
VLEQLAGGRSESRRPQPVASLATAFDPRQRIRDRITRIDYDGTSHQIVITLKPPSSEERA